MEWSGTNEPWLNPCDVTNKHDFSYIPVTARQTGFQADASALPNKATGVTSKAPGTKIHASRLKERGKTIRIYLSDSLLLVAVRQTGRDSNDGKCPHLEQKVLSITSVLKA